LETLFGGYSNPISSDGEIREKNTFTPLAEMENLEKEELQVALMNLDLDVL
jgi:hypothetical protein